MSDESDYLGRRIERLEDSSRQMERADLMDRLQPRIGFAGQPQEPETGYTPFLMPSFVALGVVDWATLAASLLVAPVASTKAIPTKGVASSLPLSDHDHGLVKGPPLEGLVVTYSGPGVPTGVTRTDTPGGVVSATVINYSGAQVASVVTTRTGYTITTTPTYTGADITSVARVVA